MATKTVEVTYCVRHGCQEELLRALDEHYALLTSSGYITERYARYGKSTPVGDVVVEVLDWVDASRDGAAHQDPAVQVMWNKLEGMCERRGASEPLTLADAVHFHTHACDPAGIAHS